LPDYRHHKGNVKIPHLATLQTGDSAGSGDVVSQPNSYCQTRRSWSFLLAPCASCSPSNTIVLSRLLCKLL